MTVAMFLILNLVYSQKDECKIKKDYDEFSEMTSYQGKIFRTSKEKYPVEIQFLKMLFKTENYHYSMVVSGNIRACVTRKARVIFIMKNGDKMYFERSSDKIDCGVSHMIVNLTKEDLEKLSNESIDKGRLDYDDGQEDFIFSEKAQSEFISNLKCIQEIK